MKYIEPVGAIGPANAYGHDYVDRNAGAGIAGSFVAADAIEHPILETLALIAKSGITPTDTDLEQVARAVRSQRLNYGVAGGTANAATITLDPVPASHADLIATPLRVRVTHRNTGPVTLAVGALPAAPLVRSDGLELNAGDLLPDEIVAVIWDGAAFRMVGVARSMVPIVLTAAQTFWIRSDGDDSNDGSANDAGHAFQTLRGAWDAIATRYAPSDKYPITLRLGMPGDYEGVLISGYGGKVIIQGDEANKLVYNIIERAGTTYCLSVNGANVEARGVTFDSRVASGELLMLWALRGGRVGIRNVGFRRKVHNAALIMIYIASGGSVFTQGQIDLAGPDGFNVNIKAVVQTDIGGTYEGGVYADPTTYRPYNLNPGTGFAWATALSLQSWLATTMSPIGVGSSGKRFTVDVNSAINTGGAGVNYFPGGSAGTAATGGLYL